MNTGKDDQRGVGRGRLPGEAERIADIIGHVLDVRLLIVMRQQHRIFLPLEAFDRVEHIQGGIDLLFDESDLWIQHRKVRHLSYRSGQQAAIDIKSG